jgi:hypothetical protein
MLLLLLPLAVRTCSAVPSGCSYSTKARKKARMQAAMQATVGVKVLCAGGVCRDNRQPVRLKT